MTDFSSAMSFFIKADTPSARIVSGIISLIALIVSFVCYLINIAVTNNIIQGIGFASFLATFWYGFNFLYISLQDYNKVSQSELICSKCRMKGTLFPVKYKCSNKKCEKEQ